MSVKEKILNLILIIIFILVNYCNVKLFKQIRKYQNDIKQQAQYKEDIEEKSAQYYDKTVVEEIDNKITFYSVKFCVDKYFSTISSLWTDTTNQKIFGDNEWPTEEKYILDDYAVKELLAILPAEYKKENNINSNTIGDKYSYLKTGKAIMQKAYKYDINQNMSSYLINGYYIANDGTEKSNFCIMVVKDRGNNTFEVFPDDYMQKKGLKDVELGDKLDWLKDIQPIEKNDFNVIVNNVMTDERIAENYFYLYKFNMKYDKEAAYNMLDKEYREKRFGSLSNYENYVESNFNKLISSMTKYSVNNNNKEYTQYVCIDEKGYYYIFRQKNFLEYSLILDTYTIEIPEFIEKYEKSNNKEKTILNIQKFADSLNDENYNYAYSCLADSFKNNYFKDVNTFKKYIENNFPETFEVSYLTFEQVSEEYYTYLVKITNGTNEITKTFIIKLGEGTSFALSFDV